MINSIFFKNPAFKHSLLSKALARNIGKLRTIEVKYEKLQDKIDNLPQAILAKAFRGELI